MLTPPPANGHLYTVDDPTQRPIALKRGYFYFAQVQPRLSNDQGKNTHTTTQPCFISDWVLRPLTRDPMRGIYLTGARDGDSSKGQRPIPGSAFAAFPT